LLVVILFCSFRISKFWKKKLFSDFAVKKSISKKGKFFLYKMVDLLETDYFFVLAFAQEQVLPMLTDR